MSVVTVVVVFVAVAAVLLLQLLGLFGVVWTRPSYARLYACTHTLVIRTWGPATTSHLPPRHLLFPLPPAQGLLPLPQLLSEPLVRPQVRHLGGRTPRLGGAETWTQHLPNKGPTNQQASDLPIGEPDLLQVKLGLTNVLHHVNITYTLRPDWI